MTEGINTIQESETINIEDVKLNRKWAFWESYEEYEKVRSKDQQPSNYLLEKIFDFDDLISFWQFWNKYPGSNPWSIFYSDGEIKFFFEQKYRISSMNFFLSGVRPEWEDEACKEGSTLTLEYVVNTGFDEFKKIAKEQWDKLIFSVIGESIIGSEYINGIRFVDKTQRGTFKKVMFRFEIWVNKSCPNDVINALKEHLKQTYGDQGITVKKIK